MATATLSSTKSRPAPAGKPAIIPREHGATAMLLIPFVSAAILLREFHWLELAAFGAIAAAFAIKDPLVVLARQSFVWKQEHAETRSARRIVAIELFLLAACGAFLLLLRDRATLLILFAGASAFTALAVRMNVKNRQRAVWFQAGSAAGLASTCVLACLSVQNSIPSWCWLLWLAIAMQAATGIFVVHARLDARIAARGAGNPSRENRRAAFVCLMGLLIASAIFTALGRYWIGAAMAAACIGYFLELRRQRIRQRCKRR